LNQVTLEIHQSKNELKSEGKIITSHAIKARYLKEDQQNHSVNDIIKYHNEDMVGKLKWGTQKNYFTTQRYINEFIMEKYNVSDFFLKQLDFNFILKFEKFLRDYSPLDHQKPIGNNTVMKHIERFRKMVILAHKLEWIKRDPFMKFEAKFDKVERGYLTQLELQKIGDKHFSISRLQLVKDLFIFSCFTGLSYIDVINLNNDNINYGIDGELWIIMKREKTNNPLRIPILPKALRLISKYKKDPKSLANGTIFPKLSNQKLNLALKEIADLCEIKKNITFHLARHTFATTVTLSNGVPIETVSKLLGHSRISTTQIYAKVVEKKVSEDMQKLKIYYG
jgi:site-specific recombinase XerD